MSDGVDKKQIARERSSWLGTIDAGVRAASNLIVSAVTLGKTDADGLAAYMDSKFSGKSVAAERARQQAITEHDNTHNKGAVALGKAGGAVLGTVAAVTTVAAGATLAVGSAAVTSGVTTAGYAAGTAVRVSGAARLVQQAGRVAQAVENRNAATRLAAPLVKMSATAIASETAVNAIHNSSKADPSAAANPAHSENPEAAAELDKNQTLTLGATVVAATVGALSLRKQAVKLATDGAMKYGALALGLTAMSAGGRLTSEVLGTELAQANLGETASVAETAGIGAGITAVGAAGAAKASPGLLQEGLQYAKDGLKDFGNAGKLMKGFIGSSAAISVWSAIDDTTTVADKKVEQVKALREAKAADDALTARAEAQIAAEAAAPKPEVVTLGSAAPAAPPPPAERFNTHVQASRTNRILTLRAPEMPTSMTALATGDVAPEISHSAEATKPLEQIEMPDMSALLAPIPALPEAPKQPAVALNTHADRLNLG